jgi:DNA-binding GntR family transcriptional regulator
MPFAQNTRQVDNKSEALVVAEALRSAVLKGELVGGDRVRQDHVATKFGVSQMIVREAFKQLVAEGFLAQEPCRGACVMCHILATGELLVKALQK